MFSLNSKDIEYLVGKNIIKSISFKPFDNLVCEFLSEFSKNLLKNKKNREYTDIVALAFWCSSYNLLRLKKNYDDSQIRFGRGLIFHITPSNVPTNFIYSLLFGIISGNSNIVKVPTNKFIQIDIICNELNKILKKKKYLNIKSLITILRYKDSDKNLISEKLSKNCDLRIIWGGDKTINTLREFKIQPHASDITFGDRYSLSIINADKLNRINKNELKILTKKFFNDTYLVDQNACSSPHIVLWYSKKNIKRVAEKFWTELNKKTNMEYILPEIAIIEKYTNLCKDFALNEDIHKNENYSSKLMTIKLKKLKNGLENFRGKWGYFYEYELKNLSKLSKIINKKFQTLTYYGFSKNELVNFINDNNIQGIDRIVPIGQALNMDLNWDGYDIISSLSRRVIIK